jgi:COP9 signalosome complex subunit 5
MAMHAKSGGNIEVMGVMQGKVIGDTFIVIDAFALPVEGTETRVNAASEANEYMVDYLSTAQASGRPENVVGWYHSHPGYGCWLSGIDVNTQMTNQQFQEPFLAVVIDPHRTIAAGKVDLGAFRTYPAGYLPPDEAASQYQTIPLDKIEDFGVHAKQYYPLDVSYFKSGLDTSLLRAIWGKYWIATLSSSPLLSTRELVQGQLADVASKLEAAGSSIAGGPMGGLGGAGAGSGHLGKYMLPSSDKKKEESKLEQIARDSSMVGMELMRGLSTHIIKNLLFNRTPCRCGSMNGDGGVHDNIGNSSKQGEVPMES